ncbi:MAG: hypothetical protein R3B70_26535 [Polyangiaceae bacterium]
MARLASLGLIGALVVSVAASVTACDGGDATSGSAGAGASGGATSGGTAGQGGTGNMGGTGGELFGGGGTGTSTTGQGFDVQPGATQTLTVGIGEQTPTLMYTATLNGNPANAGWGVDKGEIGTVNKGPGPETVFTPTGTTGGTVNVVAGLNMQTVSRSIFVKLSGEQNGYDPNNPLDQPQIAGNPGDLLAGGGIGGVGGEGLGPKVDDQATLDALDNPSGDGAAEGLTMLYPYDQTVWPRGLLAPLLQWRWSVGDADAVRIELSTDSGSFSWKGTFARPEVLVQNGKPFIRHPIPQSIWSMATNTAGGADKLHLKVVVAKDGKGYGPLSQTWTIAPARLSGTIYYGSYGTKLAQNYTGAVGGDGKFGGAVLSIRVGDTGPKLAAGANGTPAECRVCHSVSADGSRLIAQLGANNSASSLYDLSPGGTTETPLAIGASFPGMYHDGSMALSPSAQLLPLPNNATPLPATGLTSYATNIGTPTFAPSGKLVAFNPMAGPQANPQHLVVMSFDLATLAFSNPVVVVDDVGQPAQTRPGWAAFFPDGKSVVFHHQSAAGVDGNNLGDLRTRKGAKAHLAWTGTADAQSVTPLNWLNGKDQDGNSYLPKLTAPINMSCTGDGAQVGNIDTDHGDDVNLNYEPTVNPIASGGYAWVVFTSRRLYGNVATIPPFCSDPRGVDLFQNVTTKKLWVAAIDLSGAPGADASHPAFYLPAQELLAGNSRGFWVLDPCKPNGEDCDTGDECCGGFCQPVGEDGALICSDTPPDGTCSKPQEKCDTAADCCDPTNICVGGFCTQKEPS